MSQPSKRIMVDMSATLIHHGHIRLLKKASEHGDVIVGLTTDEEIVTKKGYTPELTFKQRKEILESIKYVSEVVAVPWLLTDATLAEHNIDLLIHGDDNSNLIEKENLLVFPRAKGISSSDMRIRSYQIHKDKKNNDFDKWNEIKKSAQKAKRVIGFKPREIFWVRVGQNIGSEEYGKGNEFQRPVLIVRKLNTKLFIGIPLSSQEKVNSDYFHTIEFNTKRGLSKNSAMILQLKTFDKKRLMSRIEILDKKKFSIILEKIRGLFILS